MSLLSRARSRLQAADGERVAKSMGDAPGAIGVQNLPANFAQTLAQRYVASNGGQVPSDIAQAMEAQGFDPTASFSPGTPISPFYGYGRRPRAWDMPTGWNITSRPRASISRASFDTLKQITSAYDVARICINHRVDSIRSFEYRITPQPGHEDNADEAIELAGKVMERPDGRNGYSSWLAIYLEDVLRYDAGTLYRRRNRTGQVIGLEVISGATIAPLLDYYGRRPVAPAPAYAQYVNGVVWDWLTDADLIYAPFRPQSDSPYGVAPMESILLNANSDLRLQQFLLDFWTEGSIPGGLAEAPEDMTSPDQIAMLQDAWDAFLEGDQTQKTKVRWVPAGTKFQQLRPNTFDEALATWLMKKTAAGFGIVPQDLGLTNDVNRATADTQMDIQERIGDLPLVQHVQGIVNRFLQKDLLLPVEFSMDTGRDKEDRLAEANTWKVYIETGIAGVDEAREQLLGLPTDPSRPVPRFILSPRLGPLPLDSLFAITGPVDPETMAPIDTAAIDTAPFKGAEGIMPIKMPGGTQFHKAPIDPDEPDFPELEHVVPGTDTVVPSTPAPVVKAQTAGVTAATGIEGVNLRGEDDDDDDEDEAVRKELARWRSNARNRVKNGRAPRTFTSDVMPDSIHDAVMKHLGSATTRAEVDSAFETVVLPKDRRVTKAVSSDPSAFQWPGHRFDQRLAAHYADQLLKALQDTRGITEAQAAARAALGGSDIESMAVAAAQLATDQNLTFDTDSLVSILRGIYADSYLAGTHAATMAVGQAGHVLASFAGLDSGIDWAKWEPGYAAAAEQVRDGGLEKLLAAADLRVKGIIGSTLSDLGNVLAKGLLNGDSVQTIGRAMRDIVADPNRAFLIANTETARSLGAATLATYTANGVTGKRWLTFQPCDICEANESQGVIATGDSFDSGDAVPPAHPRCRCAVAPARLIEGA